MKFIYISPVVWNFYKGRQQEFAGSLCHIGNSCKFLNPVRYKNWKQSSLRLHDIQNNPADNNIEIINRDVNINKSLLVLVYENFSNMRQVIKHQPDFVLASDHLMSVLCCIYCWLTRKKFVFDVTDDWYEVDESWSGRFFWKYIAKPILGRLSYSIISTSVKQTELFSKLNKNSYHIPNAKSEEDISKFISFDTADNNMEVNFISNLRNWYDFDLMIDVFKMFPQIKLNIYGDGELKSYIKSKIECIDNIALYDSVHGDQFYKINRRSLFGILPLKDNKLNQSTLPIKLLDYFASQKAIIATSTYELKNVSEDIIYFAKTKKQWIDKITLLINDEEIRRRSGNDGFNLLTQKFNYNILTKHFVEKIIK